MLEKPINPIHPGEVLLKEFLEPMNITPEELAKGIKVNLENINQLILNKSSITAEIALRLARFFGTSPQFWLGLQTDYDLDVAEDILAERLEKEVQVFNR